MVMTSKDIPLSRSEAKELEIDIVPGVRQRLIAELDRLQVVPEQREHCLSNITGRALQTVARWIDNDKPGLPDLKSLAIVCLQFNIDANWILGLTAHRIPFPQEQMAPAVHEQLYRQDAVPLDWIGQILSQATPYSSSHRAGLMHGDDMAPLIQDGAVYFFDTSVNEIDINGVYVLAYQGKTLVRHVEIMVGEGLLLRCENPRYNTTLVKMSKATASLSILGRVRIALNLVHV